jgi:hypothetical protein
MAQGQTHHNGVFINCRWHKSLAYVATSRATSLNYIAFYSTKPFDKAAVERECTPDIRLSREMKRLEELHDATLRRLDSSFVTTATTTSSTTAVDERAATKHGLDSAEGNDGKRHRGGEQLPGPASESDRWSSLKRALEEVKCNMHIRVFDFSGPTLTLLDLERQLSHVSDRVTVTPVSYESLSFRQTGLSCGYLAAQVVADVVVALQDAAFLSRSTINDLAHNPSWDFPTLGHAERHLVTTCNEHLHHVPAHGPAVSLTDREVATLVGYLTNGRLVDHLFAKSIDSRNCGDFAVIPSDAVVQSLIELMRLAWYQADHNTPIRRSFALVVNTDRNAQQGTHWFTLAITVESDAQSLAQLFD